MPRKIVCDFDDTLCIHPDNDKSDILSGKPNIELINELNRLFDLGYVIDIFTARGHLSASSREEADKKYRPIIIQWLRKHNVKFNALSFNKPYAIMYIDDKAVRPNELLLLKEIKD